MTSIRRFIVSTLARTRWLQCPTAALVALLQRTPIVQIANYVGDAFSGGGAASTALVRSATALAALGAIDTMAGATTLVASTPSPLAATSGTGIPVVAFGVNGTQGPPESWTLKSSLPAGITFGGLTGPGTIDTANPLLQGTPTVSGTYFLDLVAYEYPGGAATSGNIASPDFLYTINVAQGVVIPPVTIVSSPSPQTVAPGTTAVFSVVASSSSAMTYQWSANGANIAGATSPRLVVVSPGSAGTTTYTVLVTNAAGGSNSASTTLNVSSTTNPGRLINESVLTPIPTGGTLTVGFSTANGTQRLLIRGVGPTLAKLGVSGVMPDPAVQVIPLGSQSASASDDNWGADAANINAADSATGAFALTGGSLDAALITTPSAQANSVILSGNTTGGSALAEIYDYSVGTYTPASPRIVNLSTRFTVSSGATLSAGFIVGGTTAKTFLIRAGGPALSKAPFNLSNTMADPALTLVYQGNGAVIATNQGWGGDAQIAAAAAAVGAFPYPTNPSLADSALLVTLAPGNYTAEANSARGGAGQVLIEVYEVP